MIRQTRNLFATTVLTTLLLVLASPALAQLPDPGVEIDPSRAALVVTDPQNDFLSPDGVTWGVVGKSVTKNGTVGNLEKLFKAAKAHGLPVFVSPHYYYPTDHGWHFEGALEALMHKIGMFDRKDALNLDGFKGSGADWLERYKPYIEDGKTIVTSPHKVYGPETNDLVLQLRNSVSVASVRSSSPGCRPTSASSRTCGSFSSRASRSPLSPTPPPPPRSRRATATRRR